MSTLSVDTIQGQTTAANVKLPTGSIVQVVNVNGNAQSTANTTSGSFTEADTAFRTTITPKFSSSKIMFFCTLGLRMQEASGSDVQASYRLYDVTAGAAVSGTESAVRYYDYGNSGTYASHSHAFNVLIDSWGTSAKTLSLRAHGGNAINYFSGTYNNVYASTKMGAATHASLFIIEEIAT